MYEDSTHSFIIKIWLEETVKEAGQAVWRGHITHVHSGKQRYLKGLDDMSAFIVPYLEAMGVKFTAWWRLKRSLKRWGLHLTGRG